MEHDEKVRRGQEAKRVLEHPLYLEAQREIRERLVSELEKAEITPERVAHLQHLLAAGALYRRYLERVVNEGKAAAVELAEQKKERSFIEKWRAFAQ